jgi:hypothetical protein
MTFEDIASLMEWFEENETCHIIPYIEQNFKEVSFAHQLWLMRQHLFFAKQIIENERMSNEEKINVLMRSATQQDNKEGKIILVDGAMGGGKTGFGCWFIDEYHKRKPYLNYFFVTKSEQKPRLPSWFKVIEDITDTRPNSIALIDEGAINLNSRRAMTRNNVETSELLVKLRQKGITMIFLVQNIKMIDPNVRRLSSIRVLKWGIDFGSDDNDSDDVKLIRKRLKPKDKTEAYMEIYSSSKYFNFKHGLPEWWDDEKVSKYMKNWDKKPTQHNQSKPNKMMGLREKAL